MTVSSADIEEQNDEILALSGILETSAFSHSESKGGGHSGVMHVEARIPGDGSIEILAGPKRENFSIRFLPPIKLEFKLPTDYPSISCPMFNIVCPWLLSGQKARLESRLQSLWDEQGGGVILFTWLYFLQEELLEYLDIKNQIDINVFASEHKNLIKPAVKANCNQETYKIIDDDELVAVEEKSRPLIIDAEDEDKLAPPSANHREFHKCTVLHWDINNLCGTLSTAYGEALVKHTSIAAHNWNKLEASLDVGEQVQCFLEERKSEWEGVPRFLEAHNVTGLGGQIVKGHKHVDNVDLIEPNVIGTVIRWNLRNKDGMLKSKKGDVYVYYTCVQEENPLRKGDQVKFHVVKSLKWGILASYVRRYVCEDELRDEAKEFARIEKETNMRLVEEGLSGMTGKVKKWNDASGKGIIRNDVGKEWCFSIKDCIVQREEGFKMFKIGDHVKFQEINKSHWSIPRAVDVDWFTESGKSTVKNQFCSGQDQQTNGEPIQKDRDTEIEDLKGSNNKGSNSTELSQTKSVSPEPMKPSNTEDKTDENEMNSGSVTSEEKVLTLLMEFNNMKMEEEFAVSLNSCQICFTDKVGSQCLRFIGCEHVYCRDCMTNYFTEKITTGAVSSLICPTFKCETQALPNQVADLVPFELFNKYETLLLETQLESMTDVVLCPRVVCQCPTMIDRETNMGQCPACHLAFCIYCKATYHGVSPCKFKTSEQRAILDRYQNSTGDEKAFMEKRYGKKQLETMSATLASEDYMASNARQCPHCNAPIEKNEGCNKITCWRCNTNFCWLCGSRLPQTNPYTHFNIEGGKCFGALFQGVDPGEADREFDDFFNEEDDWHEIQAAIVGI